MNPDRDAMAAALEQQAHELASVIARLRRARHRLVPEPSSQWRGAARAAFDGAVHVLAFGLDTVIDDVLAAHRETLQALGTMRLYG